MRGRQALTTEARLAPANLQLTHASFPWQTAKAQCIGQSNMTDSHWNHLTYLIPPSACSVQKLVSLHGSPISYTPISIILVLKHCMLVSFIAKLHLLSVIKLYAFLPLPYHISSEEDAHKIVRACPILRIFLLTSAEHTHKYTVCIFLVFLSLIKLYYYH